MRMALAPPDQEPKARLAPLARRAGDWWSAPVRRSLVSPMVVLCLALAAGLWPLRPASG